MKTGRKVFLTIRGAAVTAAGAFRSRHGFGVLMKEPGKETDAKAAVNPFVRGGKSLVSAGG